MDRRSILGEVQSAIMEAVEEKIEVDTNFLKIRVPQILDRPIGENSLYRSICSLERKGLVEFYRKKGGGHRKAGGVVVLLEAGEEEEED